MHFFVISLASIFMIGFVTSFTIILTGDDDDFSGFAHDNKISVEKFVTHNKRYNVLESMYTSQDVGKSHRFYFTAGERQDGDKLLGYVAKQTGWKVKYNAVLNLTFPESGANTKKLNYVFVKVIQESDINRIHIFKGGINETSIGITIIANETRYLTYNATFYGV